MKLYLHIDSSYNVASCIRVLNLRLLPKIVWLNGGAFTTPELRAYFAKHPRVHGLKVVSPDSLMQHEPSQIWVFSNNGCELQKIAKLQKIATEIGATFEHFLIETVDFKCSK